MVRAVSITVLLVVVVFVSCVLGWFWVGRRYGMPSEVLGPEERAWVSREAGELLAELAPGVALLAERERALAVFLRGEEVGALGVKARRRLDQAGLRGVREVFARVSVLVDEDPARAVRELPALRALLEEGLEACDEVLGMLGGVLEMGDSVERGEGRGRA